MRVQDLATAFVMEADMAAMTCEQRKQAAEYLFEMLMDSIEDTARNFPELDDRED
jgi:hypothetical protein